MLLSQCTTRMQEFRYFRGGACVAISVQGLEWLCKRKCTQQKIHKRDSDAQLWISKKSKKKSQMVPDESELQPFCFLQWNPCGNPHGWTSKVITQSSILPAPDQETLLSLPSINTTNTKENPWEVLVNMLDNFTWFTKNDNSETVGAGSSKERCVILYNENDLARLFSDAGPCIISNGEVVRGFIDKDRSDTPYETHQTDVIHRGNLHGCSGDHEHKENMSKENTKRRSVSFSDDVIVYLFDQDSPVVELHPKHWNSPSSSRLHSDVLFDDNGLEWEDDFLALEKNCHSHSHSESCCFTPLVPSRNWTVCKPERFFLSQSCLFLTHVSESDLEL